jgi:hypothetical protein
MLDLGGTAETETCHYNSNSLAGVHADGIVMKPHPSRGQQHLQLYVRVDCACAWC